MLVKVSNFLRQKMSRPEGGSNPGSDGVDVRICVCMCISVKYLWTCACISLVVHMWVVHVAFHLWLKMPYFMIKIAHGTNTICCILCPISNNLYLILSLFRFRCRYRVHGRPRSREKLLRGGPENPPEGLRCNLEGQLFIQQGMCPDYALCNND